MRLLIALVLVLSVPAIVEAGIFRKRSGERRTPVRSVLRVVGCHNGSCK